MEGISTSASTVSPRFNGQNSSVLPRYSPIIFELPLKSPVDMSGHPRYSPVDTSELPRYSPIDMSVLPRHSPVMLGLLRNSPVNMSRFSHNIMIDISCMCTS